MKRRLLTLLPNAFFSPLIATPSPAPDVRVFFFYSRRYHTVQSAHLRGYPLKPPYRHTSPATYLNRRKPAGSDGRTPPDPAKKVTADFGLDLVPDSKITLEDFFRFADRFGQ